MTVTTADENLVDLLLLSGWWRFKSTDTFYWEGVLPQC